MPGAASNYLELKLLDHALGTATFTKPFPNQPRALQKAKKNKENKYKENYPPQAEANFSSRCCPTESTASRGIMDIASLT